MYRIGVDVGSTYTKYCVLDGDRIEALGAEKTPIRQKEFFAAKTAELLRQYPGAAIASCGYGKGNVGERSVNELTALARGGAFACPESTLLLDIGGQDTKLIRRAGSALKEFFVNDKCAAGSGLFLSAVCGMLGAEFAAIDLTGAREPRIRLSSVCAVFAQSEIVSLLAENAAGEEILQAVVWQILIKAKPLLDKVQRDRLLLSGGLAALKGIDAYASLALGRECSVSPLSRHLSALGAALSA